MVGMMCSVFSQNTIVAAGKQMEETKKSALWQANNINNFVVPHSFSSGNLIGNNSSGTSSPDTSTKRVRYVF